MIKVLAQGHNAVAPVRLEPAAHRSRVKHSTTDPLSYVKLDEITAMAMQLRPKRWSYSLVALLCPFYIKLEVQLIMFSRLSTIDALKSLCFSWSL